MLFVAAEGEQVHGVDYLEQSLEILVSPSWGQVDATELARWVLQDQLRVRVQLQLHKILWGDMPGK